MRAKKELRSVSAAPLLFTCSVAPASAMEWQAYEAVSSQLGGV
jgi:hypothetical protein